MAVTEDEIQKMAQKYRLCYEGDLVSARTNTNINEVLNKLVNEVYQVFVCDLNATCLMGPSTFRLNQKEEQKVRDGGLCKTPSSCQPACV